jgi:hypothetical protein
MPKPLEPIVKLARENERLKIDNANLRSLNKKLLRRGGGYDEFLTELKDIVAGEKKFSFKASEPVPPIVPVEKTHEEIAAVAVSDLHLSENVRLEDSNGVNSYNTMIAANRLWEHSQKVKSILTRHMAIYRIREIWSPLLGDMISGSIHPEFIPTNDLSDPASVVLCARLLFMFYTEVKALGLPINIDGVVGNHPRLSVKMPTKRVAHDNYDWLAYEYVADQFKNDEQVKVNVHTSQIGMRRLYGWNIIFEHGIDVKNGREEELEDRIRALFDDPVFREATGYKGSAFDQIVIGHTHKAKFLERTIVNGSFVGQSELGQAWRLKPVRAQQLMWGVSKKHPRTWQYQVDLTHIKSDKVMNPFSEYTSWFMRRHAK